MVDIELLIQALRDKGHTVADVHGVPENAGGYELTIDHEIVNLDQARALLEADQLG